MCVIAGVESWRDWMRRNEVNVVATNLVQNGCSFPVAFLDRIHYSSLLASSLSPVNSLSPIPTSCETQLFAFSNSLLKFPRQHVPIRAQVTRSGTTVLGESSGTGRRRRTDERVHRRASRHQSARPRFGRTLAKDHVSPPGRTALSTTRRSERGGRETEKRAL